MLDSQEVIRRLKSSAEAELKATRKMQVIPGFNMGYIEGIRQGAMHLEAVAQDIEMGWAHTQLRNRIIKEREWFTSAISYSSNGDKFDQGRIKGLRNMLVALDRILYEL